MIELRNAGGNTFTTQARATPDDPAKAYEQGMIEGQASVKIRAKPLNWRHEPARGGLSESWDARALQHFGFIIVRDGRVFELAVNGARVGEYSTADDAQEAARAWLEQLAASAFTTTWPGRGGER